VAVPADERPLVDPVVLRAEGAVFAVLVLGFTADGLLDMVVVEG